MKTIALAAFFALTSALPALVENDGVQYGVSCAEENSERDPLTKPEPNSSYTAEPADDGSFASLAFQYEEQGRGDIADIISYWEETEYPAALSYIAETRSEMIDGVVHTSYEVGLAPDTAENRAAILDTAAENALFSFTESAVPMWERELHFEKLCYIAAQETEIGFLEVRFYKNSDLIEVVVSGDEDAYYERFGRQFGGAVVFINEINDVTTIDNAGFEPGSSENKVADYIQKTANAEIFHAAAFLAAYPNGWFGDLSADEIGGELDGAVIAIGIGGNGTDITAAPLEGTIGISSAPAEKGVPIWLFVVGAAAVILAAVIAVIMRRRVKEGADGTAALHSGGAECRIISAIKNAEEQPDPRLFEKIRENIAKYLA